MPVTVRQDSRRNTATALNAMFFTSHAQVSSSRYVHLAPGRAHGTSATSTPCSAHRTRGAADCRNCLLYTSDAADEEDSVDLGGRRIIKKKKKHKPYNDNQ